MMAAVQLTNAEILHYWKGEKHSIQETLKFFINKTGHGEDVLVSSFRYSIQAIEKKKKSMQKTKALKPKLEEYLSEPYYLPERRWPAPTVDPPAKKPRGLFDCDCATLTEVNSAVCKELHETKLKMQEKEGLSKKVHVELLEQKVAEYTPKRLIR